MEKKPSMTDASADIQAKLDTVALTGGHVCLPAGRYNLKATVQINTPCTRFEGEAWSYSSDPNGVFESMHGTKLRLMADIPAVGVGVTHTAQGCLLSHFGVQGNIDGMDTRHLFDENGPTGSRGLQFANTRTDQSEFSKLSFCGLSSGVCVLRGAEIDACTFERLNLDGCATGVWFTPGAAFYPMFRNCLFADNPYYAFYADGTGINMHNLSLCDCLFIRDGGAFRDGDGRESAAVCWNNVHNGLIRDNLFDCVGTFWYYPDDATNNEQRQIHTRSTTGLIVRGNGNRIIGNCFTNSGGAAIYVTGDDNVLMNNISDADVVVCGHNNQVSGMVFTKPGAGLTMRENE